MEIVELGDSGLRASRVGLGCNNFGGRVDLEGTRAVVDAALDVGVTFFDTAEIYGNGGDSERFLGERLADGATRRDCHQVRLGARRAETGRPSASAARSTDRSGACEPTTSTSTTCTSPTRRRRSRTRSARSTSSFARARCARSDARTSRPSSSRRPIGVARELGLTRFTVLQNQYSLLERGDDEDVLPLCRELGVSYIPYFPLASGLLTGKYRRGEPAPEGTRLAGREIADDRFERVEACTAFAEERGHSLHELAICALASTPGVGSIIAGATKPEQVRANAAAAAASWQLSRRRARRAREALTNRARKPYRPHADRSRDRSITRAEGIPRSRTKGVG